MKHAILLLVAGALVATAMSATAKVRINEAVLQTMGEQAVKQLLKDPDSAKFRNVRVQAHPGAPSMLCGEVNAKTPMGGYGGFIRFISAGATALTVLELDDNDRDFHRYWARFCK